MNQFQRYLLDEFVDDYRDGRMSRRDFVMKVIGVSGGLAAAVGLFSSVGLSAAEIAAAQAAPRVAQTGPDPVTISPNDPAISVMDVQFPTTRSSTIRAIGTTRRRQRTRGLARWPGFTSTCQRGNARLSS